MAAGSTVDDFARLHHLAETQRMVNSVSLPPDELLQVVAERAQAITGADGGIVELVDGDELVRRAAAGSMGGAIGMRLRVAGTMSGRCVRLGVPMRCVDTEYDTRVDRGGCRRVGVRSMVVVPVTKGDVALGALKVLSAHPDHFGESDLEVLQEMAGLVAEVMADHPAPELQSSRAGQVTTVADRGMFVECLEQACAGADRDGTALAVFVIRLEGLGTSHDRVLRLVADALTRVVRGRDVLTRLGDEFVLICGDARESDAYGIMARISSAVRRVADSAPEYEGVSAAVGLAWRDEEHPGPEALLAAAGAAAVTAG